MKFNTRFSDNYLILLYVSFTLFYMFENVRNSLRLFINSLTIKKKTHLTNKVGNKSVTKLAFIAVCKAGFQVQKYYYFLLFQNDEAFYFSYQFLRRFLSKPHVVQSSGSKSVLS